MILLLQNIPRDKLFDAPELMPPISWLQVEALIQPTSIHLEIVQGVHRVPNLQSGRAFFAEMVYSFRLA